MSKGPRPPRNTPTIHTQEPGTEIDVIQEECWNFQLVDTTDAIKRLLKGAPVTGSVHNRNRVLVCANGEAIGFAPAAESVEIIAAAETTGGSLRGRVISDIGATSIVVRLCLSN